MGECSSMDSIYDDENLEILFCSSDMGKQFRLSIDGNEYILNKKKANKLVNELMQIFKLG